MNAIDELIKAGHIEKVGQTKDKQARFTRNEYHVHEKPTIPKPCEVFRDGKPAAENLTLSNKDLNNKNLTNTLTPDGVDEKDLLDWILHYEKVAQEKLAKNETYPHREKFPEPIRDLLDVYVKITGQHPIKKSVSDWLMTGQDWLDLGITPIDLQRAYEKSKPESGPGFTVARPGSLTNVAGVFSGERRSKGYDSDMSAVDRIAAELGVA